MMQIGRKIYYEKSTGNIILEIGERMGFVVETTTEQDFNMYEVLQQYVPKQVGCIQLEYGQFADKFGMYHYRIDPEAQEIVWGEKINPDIPEPKPTLEQQIAELKQQNLVLMDAIATMYEDLVLGGEISG